MSAGGNAEAKESNAHHKVEHWDDDDDASTVLRCDSFMVESRIVAIRNVKVLNVEKLRRSKDAEPCDPEVDCQDDRWPAAENQWCPLLDLSYHYFVGPQQLGFMEKIDEASISGTCRFPIFIALVEHETITKHVWGDQVYRPWSSSWYYVPPYPQMSQSQCRTKVSK